MKDYFKKLLGLKALPINLIGTTILELCSFCIVILATLGSIKYIWGGDVAFFIWSFVLTIWIYIQTKRSDTTWHRFREIDHRDVDFKDECDERFQKITEKLKDLS